MKRKTNIDYPPNEKALPPLLDKDKEKERRKSISLRRKEFKAEKIKIRQAQKEYFKIVNGVSK